MTDSTTKTASVTLLDGLTFDARVRGHHFMIDALGEHGDDRGPSPMEILLVALAGCTAMDVASILRKSRQPFTGVTVTCHGERSREHPRRYTSLGLRFEVRGHGVDRAAVERAVQLSEERYCSVQATLRGAPPIASEIVLRDTGDEERG